MNSIIIFGCHLTREPVDVSIKLIHQIRGNLVAMQTKMVKQGELMSRATQEQDVKFEKLALSLIDIIDMLTQQEKSGELSEQMLRLILKKVQKRMNHVLATIDVEMLSCPSHVGDGSSVMVVSTQEREKSTIGEILEVVRSGYACKGKILRPIEVVTARMD